ncbi:MAG: tetratricopeptide repeat protein [Chitinophagaceae bacterium]|nr:tetratricopeptide repeat protein [Chitinophagaceae bacterium]
MPYLRIIFSGLLILFISSCTGNEEESAQLRLSQATIEDLEAAVNKYPDSAIIIQELIQAYHKRDNYDSAIALAERTIRRDTGNSYMWNVLASLKFESSDTLGAIDALQHAINDFPLPEYYVALATIYAGMKDKNALYITDYLLDSTSTSNWDDAYFIKGFYYNCAGKPQEAIPYLDSCLASNYTYMYAYREKAIALYDMKKYEEAVKVLNRAVTIQNNYEEGYYWLGKTYEKLNKKDSAIESYQFALLYDKEFPEAREALDRLTKK